MTKLFYYLIRIFDRQTERKIQDKICGLLKNKIEILIDVGFYLGEYYENLVKKISIKNVLGFEPNPETFRIVEKKFNKNKNVKILNFALGNIKSTKQFNLNLEPSSSSFNLIDYSSSYFKRKNKILNFFGFNTKTQSKNIKIETLYDIFNEYKINNIDLLKIDTEGYEYNVLLGIKDKIKNIKIIHFEHHYDNMLIKNYKISDIHNYLITNNFKKFFKVKMKFRKSFEYLYINENFFN